jgi:hypothetical protein
MKRRQTENVNPCPGLQPQTITFHTKLFFISYSFEVLKESPNCWTKNPDMYDDNGDERMDRVYIHHVKWAAFVQPIRCLFSFWGWRMSQVGAAFVHPMHAFTMTQTAPWSVLREQWRRVNSFNPWNESALCVGLKRHTEQGVEQT